jgi:hypothetical protein
LCRHRARPRRATAPALPQPPSHPVTLLCVKSTEQSFRFQLKQNHGVAALVSKVLSCSNEIHVGSLCRQPERYTDDTRSEHGVVAYSWRLSPTIESGPTAVVSSPLLPCGGAAPLRIAVLSSRHFLTKSGARRRIPERRRCSARPGEPPRSSRR